MLALTPGCVTRKLFIRSDPPGARVMIDGEVVGTTPYEAEFVFYGTRGIEFDLAGYEWLHSTMDVTQPWYQHFPLGIFTDLLWPFEIQDHREFHYTLQPRTQQASTFEDAQEAYRRLQERFQGLRDENEDARQP